MKPFDTAKRAFIPCFITGSAVFIFVLSAAAAAFGLVVSDEVRAAAASALWLNIALIVFAWTQYKDARAAEREGAVVAAEARLRECRDPHTQLLNRASFLERAEELIVESDGGDEDFALLIIDVKRFGSINEAHGHAFGDELLRRLSAMLAEAAPDRALCGRLGGDEFAVAMMFRQSATTVLAEAAARIGGRLGAPIEIGGVTLKVRPAIGIAHLGQGCTSLSTLLSRADLAMTAGKKQRNLITWFHPGMDQVARARGEIEAGLRSGIARGEFVPHYQPQIDLRTRRIVGFEMLARWEHPSGRLLNPDLFIPVAEEAGLIDELSEYLIRQAMRDARKWDPEVTLAVNISPAQLGDAALPAKIARLLDETGFPAQRLELEITESLLCENLALAQSIVCGVKELGVTLAMDDFGTGYSSLAHLRALPFDRLKIDRSFILALNKEPESWVIVNAIINLAHNLGLEVTAEGVESAAIDLRLRGSPCDRGQGWFFGKAAPAEAARALLDDQAVPRRWPRIVTR